VSGRLAYKGDWAHRPESNPGRRDKIGKMMQERGKKRFLHHFVVVAGQIREKMPGGNGKM